MVALLSVAAVLVVAILGWILVNRFGSDRLTEITDRRRTTSTMVSRGEYVDGNRHLAVALAVTPSTFFYENADMQACLDLQWVREIEYDTELATGGNVEGEVLRLRCYSQTFEFVIPKEEAARWHQTLPPRRTVDAPPVIAQMVSAT